MVKHIKINIHYLIEYGGIKHGRYKRCFKICGYNFNGKFSTMKQEKSSYKHIQDLALFPSYSRFCLLVILIINWALSWAFSTWGTLTAYSIGLPANSNNTWYFWTDEEIYDKTFKSLYSNWKCPLRKISMKMVEQLVQYKNRCNLETRSFWICLYEHFSTFSVLNSSLNLYPYINKNLHT